MRVGRCERIVAAGANRYRYEGGLDMTATSVHVPEVCGAPRRAALRIAALVGLLALFVAGAFALGRATVHTHHATRVVVVPTAPAPAVASGTQRCAPTQHAC